MTNHFGAKGTAVRSFKDLVVWQKAHQLFLQLVREVEGFPKTRAAAIVADQLLRAVGSMSANIAEGFGRRSGAEYVHYLIVARGSTTESENWLVKCRDLGYIPEHACHEREALCQEVLKMLNAMIGTLRRKANVHSLPQD
jgi:four helix bundle protein